MIDEIDKKIIYELGIDARQSYKKLAERIGSKKEVVAYRINQLLNKGIIKKFVPVFALSRLNIFSSKIYLQLQGLDQESEKEMLDYLVKSKDIAWAARSVGRWDLMLGMYTKNIIDFSEKKNDILSRFSRYIKSYDVTQIEDAQVFNRDYLIGHPINYRKEFIFAGQVGDIRLDETDKKIIQLIKNDGRYRSVDVGEKLGLDSRTIINRVKDLQDEGILQGFTVFIDLNKLGIKFHKLCIHLEEYDKKHLNTLISFLKKYPNTIHMIKSLGSWELEIETENEKSDIYEFITQLKNRFPETIKQVDLVTMTEELKLDFFPKTM